MELGEFVSKYRKEAGLTIDELAAQSGVPKGTINKIIAGTTKSPTLETVQCLARALGKTINEFMDSPQPTTKAPLYSSEALALADDYDKRLDTWGKKQVRAVADNELARMRESQKQNKSSTALEVIQFSVTEYEDPMSAGTGQPAGYGYGNSLLLIKEPPRGTSYVASIAGDSMEPTFHNGDRLFVQACYSINVGEVGVFLMDGQQWVKELGEGVLISHNPAYKPRPMTDDIRCQGRVLGVCDKSYFEI